MRFKTLSTALLSTALLAVSLPSSAAPLSELLERAQSGEPTYLGAKTGVYVAKARVDQAFGALLPQINATAGVNYNKRRYHTKQDSIPTAKDAYNSNSFQVTLTQPLWRYANVVSLNEAKSGVLQAEYQLAGSEQELFAKLVSAWLDVLSAHDNLQAMIGQEKFTRKQWQIAQRGVVLGTSGRPQAEDARAKYDQAHSDMNTAEDDVQTKLAALEQIVGPGPEFENFVMIDSAVLANLRKNSLDHWLAAANSGNPNILAARAAFFVAEDEVSKQRAGHQPTLDVVASYGRNGQAVGGFPGQSGYDIWQGAVGLQLNVPLFSGGVQSGKVAEAVAMKRKARLDIEVARRAARLAIKQAWFGWQAAHGRAEAGFQSVKSARLALKNAHRSKKLGVKMALDELQAEQQLLVALRDWHKARYDEVAEHVKLKAAAGVATAGDVIALDHLFIRAPAGADSLGEPRP